MVASPSSFTGFPHTGLQFLRDLALNNNRDWFLAHQHVYEEQLLDPARLFVSALGEKLKTISPGIEYDAASKTGGSILRPPTCASARQIALPYHLPAVLGRYAERWKIRLLPGHRGGGTLHVRQWQFATSAGFLPPGRHLEPAAVS
jgi:hypothetical protein